MTFNTPENAALMRRFCSFGRTCEFGFAQRYCGAETLDMLRWAATPYPILIDMLRNRFAGIGEDLSLSVGAEGYMVHNSRYGTKWHAWVREGEIDPDRLLRREAARMPRMAEILLETITNADRILVRGPGAHETPEQTEALVAALAPATLLYVQPDPARAGTVERDGTRLLRGYIDNFEGRVQLAHTAVWLDICRAAIDVTVTQHAMPLPVV